MHRAQYEVAKSHARRGEYTDAVHAFDEAIGMKPEPSDVARSKARRMAQNDLAWLLATCQDSTVRDGRRAVNLAEQLVASVPGNAIFLDTLGASYAAERPGSRCRSDGSRCATFNPRI